MTSLREATKNIAGRNFTGEAIRPAGGPLSVFLTPLPRMLIADKAP